VVRLLPCEARTSARHRLAARPVSRARRLPAAGSGPTKGSGGAGCPSGRGCSPGISGSLENRRTAGPRTNPRRSGSSRTSSRTGSASPRYCNPCRAGVADEIQQINRIVGLRQIVVKYGFGASLQQILHLLRMAARPGSSAGRAAIRRAISCASSMRLWRRRRVPGMELQKIPHVAPQVASRQSVVADISHAAWGKPPRRRARVAGREPRQAPTNRSRGR